MAVSHQSDIHAGWQLPPDLRLQLLAALSAHSDSEPTMTYQEFLDWADEDTLAEWVDGKVIMTSLASLRHQLLAKLLSGLLSAYVEVKNLGIVVDAPFQMKLSRSSREPDVLFVATAHMDRLTETYLDGPADLAVEIVSPESKGRDRGDKFYEYESAGVAEYWLIDPESSRAEFYHCDVEGKYQIVAVGKDNIYRSEALPGFWRDVTWLWQTPLPPLQQVAIAVAGAEYADHLIQQLRQGGYLGTS